MNAMCRRGRPTCEIRSAANTELAPPAAKTGQGGGGAAAGRVLDEEREQDDVRPPGERKHEQLPAQRAPEPDSTAHVAEAPAEALDQPPATPHAVGTRRP